MRQIEGDDDAEIADNKQKKPTSRKSLFCSTNNEELNQAEPNRNGRGDWELGLLNAGRSIAGEDANENPYFVSK